MLKNIETRELKELHRASFGTADDARRAPVCTCFHCKASFSGIQVQHVDVERDGRETALCPHCGVNAVLPQEIAAETLDLMHAFYFTPLKNLR